MIKNRHARPILLLDLVENPGLLHETDLLIWEERIDGPIVEALPERAVGVLNDYFAYGGTALWAGTANRHVGRLRIGESDATALTARFAKIAQPGAPPAVFDFYERPVGLGRLLTIKPDASREGAVDRAVIDQAIRFLVPDRPRPRLTLILPAMTPAMRHARANPVPHSLLTDDPGRPVLDLWGWHTTPYYQRPEVVSPDYLKRRVVVESFKRGANLVEIYRGGYPIEHRNEWTDETSADLTRFIHEHDMRVQWFPHYLGLTSFTDSADQTMQLARNHFDILTRPANELIDGIGSENWSTMLPSLFNACFLPYQPGAYFYTSKHRYNRTLPNEPQVTACGGYGVDDQTSDFLSQMHFYKGYFYLDHHIEKRHGLQFFAAQAECRDGVHENRFGGAGFPDWILKQANDLFRPRARVTAGRLRSPSAIWWINEAESMTSERNRAYVYGVSQDPVKCAFTHRLFALGQNNRSPDTRKMPTRYHWPAETAFLQNNYLRLYHRHDCGRMTLVHDLERLAHYDDNSCAITLSDDLARPTLTGSDSPALACQSIQFAHVERAGYKAVLQATVDYATDPSMGDALTLRETRRLVMYADNPFVTLDIERDFSGRAAALDTHLQLPGYDRWRSGDEWYSPGAERASPKTLRLSDAGGRYPELLLIVHEPECIERIRFEPGQGLVIRQSASTSSALRISLALPGGLYDSADDQQLRAFIMQPEQVLEVGPGEQVTVKNPYDIPITRVVRIPTLDDRPYQCQEFGRWSFRGAQTSREHVGWDYLKCYLPSRGEARIQRYDFVENAIKPGWGCQNVIAIREVPPTQEETASTEARITLRSVTSFLPYPSVIFKHPVTEVQVNGRPWHYHDSDTVFLPNRPGEYDIRVRHDRTISTVGRPSLVRTGANILATSWDGQFLTFEAANPPWINSLPDDAHYYAFVRHAGRSITSLVGAKWLRGNEDGSVVRFRPGMVSVALGAESADRAVPRVDFEREWVRQLSRRAARELDVYLAPFDVERISISQLAGADRLEEIPGLLDDFDLLIWNQYYLDRIPPDWSQEALQAVAQSCRQGRPLWLISNGGLALPQLLGMPDLELNSEIPIAGGRAALKMLTLALSPTDSPGSLELFAGLEPMKHHGNVYPMVHLNRWDAFKRVVLPEDHPLLVDAEPLARLRPMLRRPDPSPAFEPSPVKWCWSLGQGRLLAYTCNLRAGMGSQDLIAPSPQELKFFRNTVRWITSDTAYPRIAVLW